MKIIYCGYVYEAVKVNNSFEKYIDELIERIKNGNLEDFTDNVLDNRGNELPITTKINNSGNNPRYYTIFLSINSDEILQRRIDVSVEGFCSQP